MADLYAKAAGGNWSAAGTWSAVSSAGVDSAGPPTAADRAIFETGSGNVTIDSAPVCRSLDATAGTGNYGGTLTHNAALTLTIGDATAGTGNVALKFSSGMTYTRVNATTSAISFVSTSATQQTITTAGKTLGNVTVNGAGSSYQLADNCTTSSGGTTTLTAGTLDLNAKTLDIGIWSSSNSNTRTLNGNGGTIILRSTGTAWSMATVTNYTSDSNFTASFVATGSQTISGQVTFGTISRTGGNNATDILQLANAVTTTSLTLDTCTFKSNTAGTARTINLSNVPTFTNVGTITDITVPSTSNVKIDTTAINGGNNTGIAFLGSPSLIQTAGVNVTTPAASATVTFGKTTRNITTSKQGIVVITQARTSSTPPSMSVTDSAGNIYYAIAGTGTAFGTTQGWHEWWWCPTSAGGVTTVTVNASINSNFGVTALELSDANTVDQLSQSTGSSTTAATGPTGTTALANELILGAAGAHLTPGTLGTAAGFQMFTTQSSSSIPVLIMRAGFQTSTSTGTYSWSDTISSSALWAATIVTFDFIPNKGSTLTTLGAG